MKQIRRFIEKALHQLKLYKYPVLILALGIVLMTVSFEPSDEKKTDVSANYTEADTDFQNELEMILECVAGAGEVQVLLSLETGNQYTYQEDVQTKTRTDETQIQRQTVFSAGGGNQMPIEIMMNYPTYRGAVVVCQGADKPTVKLAIVQAVSSLTGLGSEDIAVIKMNSN